jgi:RNA polymerase sigma-70 factor (ECF subfamily)
MSDSRRDSLMDGAARGDRDAVAVLYRRWQPRLRAYFASVNRGEADDLAAEVWVDVARGIDRFNGGESDFGGWLFTIARRRLIDARRRTATRPRTVPLDPDQLAAAAGTASEVDARLAHQAALDLVSQLPQDQAEVLLLRVVADLEAEVVACILGKTPGAVRVIQHRALRRLAEMYQQAGVTP